MPPITFDARGFSVAGRLRLILAGDVEYARLPRARWADQLDAARDAGFTAVVVPIPWLLHEPAPDSFVFEDQLDIRAFLELAGERDLLCVLRPGPFIGPPWDMGGLPSWLLRDEAMALRAPSQPFLGACARWIRALFEQVRDLQATAIPPGPVALVQNEHEWFCGSDAVGVAYINELHRYLRESGVSVPIISANNLYHSVESAIDGWVTQEDVHATLRQLRSLISGRPLLALDVGRVWRPIWKQDKVDTANIDGKKLAFEIAQGLSAGGHVLLTGFSGGTTPAALGGRSDRPGEATFVTPSDDQTALVREGGAPNPALAPVRRVCLFARSFERLFTALDHEALTTTVVPTPGAAHDSVVHAAGAQGSAVFVFAKPGERAVIPITLPDGTSDDVDTGDMGVGWRLLNYRLTPHAMLDYCGASALLHDDALLVCFAPPGVTVKFVINGVTLHATAPSGKTPLIGELEDITVALLNEEQTDALAITHDGAIVVGVDHVSRSGELVAHADFKQGYTITANHGAQRTALEAAPKPKRAPSLMNWCRASTTTYVAGVSERFARIDGPSPMERLGAPHGYVWIRLQITEKTARKTHAAFLESGDRIHLFNGGSPLGVVGVGPGAADDVIGVSLKKGENTIVVLADALGRSGLDPINRQRRGLYGHVHDAAPVRASRPTLELGKPLSPLELRAPIWRTHDSDRTEARWTTWTVEHRKKTPILLRVDPPCPSDAGVRGIVLVNGAPIDFLDDVGALRLALALDMLKRGKNVIQIAPLGDAERACEELSRRAHIWTSNGSLTNSAAWSVARWESPDDAAFEPVAKSAMKASQRDGEPVWWRCDFKWTMRDDVLTLHAAGLTKGQILLNGQSACRYWVATADDVAVEGQRRITLPATLLREGDNELLIFDEHGANPGRCKLACDPRGAAQ